MDRQDWPRLGLPEPRPAGNARVIDCVSLQGGAFSPADEVFLAAAAVVLRPYWAGGQPGTGVWDCVLTST